ncbi:MAG: N-methylhydantoinase B [Chloroflexi bacterium]|jgi:N-methylhydantoinase B|nr:MAG: N-methylhydantoinase B [Chloroflexota bacterium]
MDAITLAVTRGKLERLTDEMDMLLVQGAFSPIISEAHDRASGVYDAETGDIVVMGTNGLPNFAVTMQYAAKAVLEKAEADGIHPGDVFLINDPHATGTHLNDIKLIKPVFHGDRLACLLGNVAHWLDVGGSVAASYNPRATEIFQEGIVIPPVKIYDKGQLNEVALEIIVTNTRLPMENRGDFFTMFGCLKAGEARILELIDRYSFDTFNEALKELTERSERQMRSYIAEMPDGKYLANALMDNDGIEDRTLEIALEVEVRGDALIFDFTGTSAACRGPFNAAPPTTMAACFIALKHMYPDVPLNAGCFRPLSFVLPERSIVSAPIGSGQGFYLEASLSVAAATLTALGQAVPERAVGQPFATLPAVLTAGKHPTTGKFTAGLVVLEGGGYGGSQVSDGLINGAISVGAARMPSLEVMEQRYPVKYLHYGIRQDSGGPGEHSGGPGTEIDMEFLGVDTKATVMLDSQKNGSRGAFGGESGGTSSVEFEISGKAFVPLMGKEVGLSVGEGDRITIKSPGGGGHGNPLDRSADLVARDAVRGYVSIDGARSHYGVVLREDLSLDVEATELLRLERRERQA